jgi:hypothetical protein
MARSLGGTDTAPVVLHRSQHISVLLPSLGIVARMIVDSGNGASDMLCRELSVTRHLCERAAPIVAPSTLYPAGPHFHSGFAMTLWPFVAHEAADYDNADHAVGAAQALRRVHAALADYPGPLPSYRTKIDECGALLADGSSLTALACTDRKTLLEIYQHLVASLASFRIQAVPIHGDAHLGNVFLTASGARWTDFEAVSLGPREWDYCWVPEPSAFAPIDHDLHAVLSDMRSVCVSVWCWALAHIPEKREAAEYHLACLKTRYAS